MLVGATEDIVRQQTVPAAKAQLDLARLAGFDAVRITQIWAPGENVPSPGDRAVLGNVAAAARLDAMQVIVSVLSYGSRTAPLTDEAQLQFAAYAAGVARVSPAFGRIVVGNEPNLNRYWLPQFGPGGEDVAAPAYELLLARTYDAIKSVAPTVEVLGLGVSPRGGDCPPPACTRQTHSPTRFLLDLGTAYRTSGRQKPIMDALALHPYEDNSGIAPRDGVHPAPSTTIALADYGKLVGLLGQAFDGTAQPGTKLPIYYDEFGVEAQVPAAKARLYTGAEPAATKPVPEATQGAYYREAIALAFCQPTVKGIFLFHTRDERPLEGWQSGVYYVDGTPKSSLAAVRTGASDAHRGVAARCPGLALLPRLSLGAARGLAARVSCDIDCAGEATLVRRGRTLARKAIRLRGGSPATVSFRAPRGAYRLVVSVRAALNPANRPVLAGRPVRS